MTKFQLLITPVGAVDSYVVEQTVENFDGKVLSFGPTELRNLEHYDVYELEFMPRYAEQDAARFLQDLKNSVTVACDIEMEDPEAM